MRKKKILFILSDLSLGGAQGVFVKLGNHFSLNEEYEVTILSLTGDGPLSEKVSDKVHIVKFGNLRVSKSYFLLFDYLRKNSFDYVLSTLGYVNILLGSLIPVLRLLGNRGQFIAREGNILSLKLPSFKIPVLYLFAVKFFYRFFDAIIMQSKDMNDDFFRVVTSKKIQQRTRVINNPVFFGGKSTDKRESREKLEILFVGKLEEQKGLLPLIPHLKLITRPFMLKIYGKGSLGNKAQVLISQNNLDNKVFLMGTKKQIKPEMNKADLLILPSLYEGFPNVLVESLSQGTPVIAFECPGGVNEIVNKSNGVKVDPGNYKKFIDVINSFNYQFSQSVIIEDIRSRYSIEKIISDYESIWR